MLRVSHCLTLSSLTLILALAFSPGSPASEDNPEDQPVKIKHIVVFGNALSDNGNTCELFDELAGRKRPSRLRDDMRHHGPDIIDAASSMLFSSGLWFGFSYMHWDKLIDKIPYAEDYFLLSRAAGISLVATLLYHSGLAHLLAKPLDLVIDRSELLLQSMLWLYPSIGLPVLPPGQLYDAGGRFTNGPRVWAEMLATRMGLNPDNRKDFISLAYAGSHVRDELSGDDFLSFSEWLNYLALGSNFLDTLLHKMPTEKDSFWNIAAKNMSKDGLDKFQNLLKNDIPPSFEYLVHGYSNNQTLKETNPPDSTLYLIIYGPDDYIIDDALPSDVISTLRKGLSALINKDQARHIVVTHLSHLSQLPAVKAMNKAKADTMLSKVSEHNILLNDMIRDLTTENEGVRITTLSGGEELLKEAKAQQLSLKPCLNVIDENEEEPANASVVHVPSMTNRTLFTDDIVRNGSSLQATYRFFGHRVSRCNNPEQHLFYDDFNLTSHGHTIVADLVCKLLASNGYQCR
ncbi:SGNH/GDSL hydrolase family protein [Parendozoicomonas haliclonae]|uniref:Uncharacterized protein n=1 Tax=Parendozoicomonas haliclonae TaxID=1960125 RepID=A0A1X7AJI9_9GAMM|nr:SGNH/GDSL hydrolase family protein [Parendozoicomonas haliclonae]SMA46685.1 hypothetical protein EHSB41UT_02235 [Parendozoicomonas haliclonae]